MRREQQDVADTNSLKSLVEQNLTTYINHFWNFILDGIHWHECIIEARTALLLQNDWGKVS